MKKRISSSLTFFYKVIFPILAIGGIGYNIYTLIINRGFRQDIIITVIAFTAGLIFVLWGCVGLKKIEVDKNKIYISNFIKKIEMDKRDIKDVTEKEILNVQRVWINFRNTTEFGDKVVFMPNVKLSGYSSRSILEEFEEYANKNE